MTEMAFVDENYTQHNLNESVLKSQLISHFPTTIYALSAFFILPFRVNFPTFLDLKKAKFYILKQQNGQNAHKNKKSQEISQN